MPLLIRTSWNGQIHHSIEYGERKRPRERLGLVLSPKIAITDEEAAAGLEVLVQRHFPQQHPEPDYYGA